MLTAILWCLIIIVARVIDVSLATIRTIVTIQGRRGLAVVLSVVELLIWVFIISQVINELSERPAYGVAYAIGFALGTFVGMTIEQRLALGRQVVRIITRRGPELSQALRTAGLTVTQFDGYGRDGPVEELFIEIERRQVQQVVAKARELDPECYYMVEDIRLASSAAVSLTEVTQRRSAPKRK